MSKLVRKIILVLMFFLYPALTIAQSNPAKPNFEREKRLMNQVVDAIFEGEVIDLKAGLSQNFKAIFYEADKKSDVAVIILHNRGYHFDWEEVIQPLRVFITEQGFSSLSVQMPVLDKQATYYDYIKIFDYSKERIISSIQYLKKQGFTKIVLMGHGCGVHMSINYLNEFTDKELAGFVGIGMDAVDNGQKMQEAFPFDKMKIPVLDIYGGNDFPAVVQLASQRKKLAQNLNDKSIYTQIKIEKADHYYKSEIHTQLLLENVLDWLKTIEQKRY